MFGSNRGILFSYVPSVQLLRQAEVAGYAFSTAPVTLAFVAACAVKEPTLTLVGKYSDEVKQERKGDSCCSFVLSGHDADEANHSSHVWLRDAARS